MARSRAKVKRSRGLAPALAKPGDPYVTASGALVFEEETAPTLSTAIEPTRYKATKKRVLKELPAAPNIMNGVGCVFLYTVLGISDREMADALKISVQDVETIRSSQPYIDSFETVVEEFISANSEIIQLRIAAMAGTALSSVCHIAREGSENNKLRASVDLLDRGGHTKKEKGRGSMVDDGLRITYTKDDNSVSVELQRMEQ